MPNSTDSQRPKTYIRMKIYAHFQERIILITFSIVIQKKSDIQPIMMRLIKKARIHTLSRNKVINRIRFRNEPNVIIIRKEIQNNYN